MDTEIVDFDNGVGPVALRGPAKDRYTFRNTLIRIVNIEKGGHDASEDRLIAKDFLVYYREHGLTEIT